MSYLFFDTETTGFPVKGAPWSDERQPHLVQIAAILYDKDFNEVANVSEIIYPEAVISGHEQSWIIPESAAKIHRITQARAVEYGKNIHKVLNKFNEMLLSSKMLIAHNIDFDLKILKIAYTRIGSDLILPEDLFCTMKSTTDICKIPNKRGWGGYKWPNLSELHTFLFNESFDGAHDALVDVKATARCFMELKNRSLF
ncbi:DNA polymerase III subunit epsilon [bacterium]|nr:DNA polymerase III subunit epsilon [bacterium]